MTSEQILDACRELGIILTLGEEPGTIQPTFAEGVDPAILTPERIAKLRAAKPGLLALLQSEMATIGPTLPADGVSRVAAPDPPPPAFYAVQNTSEGLGGEVTRNLLPKDERPPLNRRKSSTPSPAVNDCSGSPGLSDPNNYGPMGNDLVRLGLEVEHDLCRQAAEELSDVDYYGAIRNLVTAAKAGPLPPMAPAMRDSSAGWFDEDTAGYVAHCVEVCRGFRCDLGPGYRANPRADVAAASLEALAFWYQQCSQ